MKSGPASLAELSRRLLCSTVQYLHLAKPCVFRMLCSFVGRLLRGFGDAYSPFVLWPGETQFSGGKCDLAITIV